MRYRVFYYLAVFSKIAVIFCENGKKPFLGPKSLLKGRRHLATKKNITSHIGNEVLNIFHLTIFSKEAIFLETEEKILGGHDHFLGGGVILRQK